MSRASEAEIAERLSGLISDVVKRQMVSDVPIGVMLSGGLHSIMVATIISKAAG